jgi:hypothetical protein
VNATAFTQVFNIIYIIDYSNLLVLKMKVHRQTSMTKLYTQSRFDNQIKNIQDSRKKFFYLYTMGFPILKID